VENLNVAAFREIVADVALEFKGC